MSHISPAILRYDGHNGYWCLLMENFWRANELWDAVENEIGKEDKDKKGEYATRKLMNMKAKIIYFR